MLNSIGVTNVHTNPYAPLEDSSIADKINTRQTTDNLTNHARSAVIPQSPGDRAPLNAIMAMEAAASMVNDSNPSVKGMLENFSLTSSSASISTSCDGRPGATAVQTPELQLNTLPNIHR
jgi:hypothetical protein